MTFSADVRRFTEQAEKAADKTVRAITFGLFREVIQRTPVDTGRLKGNWQASVGSPSSVATEATDKAGAATIGRMAGSIGGLGSESFLANNLPYAGRIEFDGWSKVKAPQGMVRVSLARIRSIVQAAIRQNKV